MQSLQNCIGPTIRIGRDILCLPYAGFFASICKILTWIQNTQEVWKRLDKQYRDNELAIESTLYMIESFKVPQGPAHKMIQALALELRIAKT